MRISWKRLFIFILIITVIVINLIIFLVESNLRPIFHEIAKVKASNLVTKRLNQAVYEEAEQLTYDDLIFTKTDQQGNIIFMQPDLQKINQFSSRITLEIQNKLREMKNKIVKLPLSKLFGIEVLAKHGPKLNARISSYSSVQTDIVDYFQSAGINQTRHNIDLKVSANIKMIIPFLSEKVKVQTTVPLTEAVIVGKVPEVYVGLEEGLIKKK